MEDIADTAATVTGDTTVATVVQLDTSTHHTDMDTATATEADTATADTAMGTEATEDTITIVLPTTPHTTTTTRGVIQKIVDSPPDERPELIILSEYSGHPTD